MLDLTAFLRLYQRRRYAKLAAMDQGATQEQQLLKLLYQAKDTKFGTDHKFSSIRSVSDFQTQVPLRNYDAFWNEYWKAPFPSLNNCTWPGLINLFPVSSGTSTGATKYIPCSPDMVKSNSKAGLDLLSHHLANRPQSRLFGGKSFMLGGSTDLVEQAPGIFSGDLSGIAVKTMPWWARMRYFPPAELALIKDWEKKIDVLARTSLQEDIRLVSGVPNWMVIFFGKLFSMHPEAEGKLGKLFPNLEMIVHGGVNFTPYVKQFEQLLEGSHAETREVYPASEGFIAVADRGFNEGLRMVLDHGIFFEFVPLEELNSPNPTRHWIGNIQKDINYAIVLSTCAGVWSYILGDTVRFVDTNPARLLITGRTSYYLSAFGEHLIAEEVEQGVMSAAQATGLSLSDYSVGAVYPERSGALGGHLYYIELADGQIPSEKITAEFLKTLDRKLCKLNEDYEAHRIGDVGMLAPQVAWAKPGFFLAWMKERGKLGGQNKVPRIISDPKLFESLRSFHNKH